MSIIRYKVTPTITAGAYAANDVIGGRLQFVGARKGTLQSVTITDKAAQAVAYILVLFESQPTGIADNATFDIDDADLDKIIYQVPLGAGGRQAFTDNIYHYSYGLNVPLKAAGNSIWGFLIASASTPTYASTSDITVTLQMETESPWSA